jgi:hypothetical protein
MEFPDQSIRQLGILIGHPPLEKSFWASSRMDRNQRSL